MEEMKKAEIIKAICESHDYRFTHDELMRMSKKELTDYYGIDLTV